MVAQPKLMLLLRQLYHIYMCVLGLQYAYQNK